MERLKNIQKNSKIFFKNNMRPNLYEYYLAMAYVASLRSTCSRRNVGTVLTDKHDRVLSTGCNGNYPKAVHCIDKPCPGAKCASGQGLDKCEAIHAEVNAIGNCHDVKAIRKCYSTTSPCIHCVKALLATPCKEIIFYEEYPHSKSKVLWEKAGRKWTHYESK